MLLHISLTTPTSEMIDSHQDIQTYLLLIVCLAIPADQYFARE